MTKTNCQGSHLLNPPRGEILSPLLSSTSVENEKHNVRQYLNYGAGFFVFSRMEAGNIPNRFYPTLEEAFRTTLTHCKNMGKIKNSKHNMFRISNSAHKTIYEGKISPSGRITFSIYNGVEKEMKSTIDNELSKFINKKMMTTKKNTVAKTTKQNKFKKNDMATTLSSKSKTFIENGILTPENVKFLCLTEDSAKSIAQTVQDTSIGNKQADNQSFIENISKVSDNMISITKTLASGKPIDNDHVSFHDDFLYCASHCKSRDALFDGKRTWKKTPGKIAYTKIADVIMDMYYSGQKMLMETETTDSTETTIPVQTITTSQKKSLSDVVKDLTATVMTYLHLSDDMRYYLTLKNSSLEQDMTSLTNGVLSAAINNDSITFKTLSGQSKELMQKDFSTDELLRAAISSYLSQMFVGASISDKTRNLVSDIINIDTIEDYYLNPQTSIAA